MPTKGLYRKLITPGPVYTRRRESPWFQLPMMKCFYSCMILWLDCIQAYRPILGMPPHRKNTIYLFQPVQLDWTTGFTSSSWRMCAGDSNKVEWSALCAWLRWQIHMGCQTDWYDAWYTRWRNRCTGAEGAREFCNGRHQWSMARD